MRSEPGRFCVDKPRSSINVFGYTITDRGSGASVLVAYFECYHFCRRSPISDDWLTNDEVLALYSAAAEIYRSRDAAWTAARDKAQRAWQKARNKAQRDWFKQQLDKGSN